MNPPTLRNSNSCTGKSVFQLHYREPSRESMVYRDAHKRKIPIPASVTDCGLTTFVCNSPPQLHSANTAERRWFTHFSSWYSSTSFVGGGRMVSGDGVSNVVSPRPSLALVPRHN
ncbi:hypothetical protein M404DRAFT_717972 [Pisolithus tinctorius Marx 270]|uniref:Uncharacterized protein n=1 Tax=Pisolithus tinctorius Marx 270 TaxID=870435 RepID=A0A0C3NLZ6_PISTI|nr:hypothetical protein M404DRAFT_717972 [Pisolithus tinctorius Marx 270]